MRRPFALALSVWLLALACSGCGYALAGSGLGGAGKIAIHTPENRTQEPGVEYIVADALRRELLRRDGAVLTDDPARADLVVSGRVVEIRSRSKSFSSAVLAREHELVMKIALQAVKKDGTELMSPRTAFEENERYFASADVEAQRKNRVEALRRVSNLLAARFFDSMGEALP
ncbi:MAG: LPS assembly lipoprotein LptE [Myxococcota bacterium]